MKIAVAIGLSLLGSAASADLRLPVKSAPRARISVANLKRLVSVGAGIDQRLTAHVTRLRRDAAHAEELLKASDEEIREQIKGFLSGDPNGAAMDTLRGYAKDALSDRLQQGGASATVANMLADRFMKAL